MREIRTYGSGGKEAGQLPPDPHPQATQTGISMPGHCPVITRNFRNATGR